MNIKRALLCFILAAVPGLACSQDARPILVRSQNSVMLSGSWSFMGLT